MLRLLREFSHHARLIFSIIPVIRAAIVLHSFDIFNCRHPRNNFLFRDDIRRIETWQMNDVIPITRSSAMLVKVPKFHNRIPDLKNSRILGSDKPFDLLVGRGRNVLCFSQNNQNIRGMETLKFPNNITRFARSESERETFRPEIELIRCEPVPPESLIREFIKKCIVLFSDLIEDDFLDLSIRGSRDNHFCRAEIRKKPLNG